MNRFFDIFCLQCFIIGYYFYNVADHESVLGIKGSTRDEVSSLDVSARSAGRSLGSCI